MTVSHQRIQRMVGIACLGALAFILMMFEFPIIPVASYLKFFRYPGVTGRLPLRTVSGGRCGLHQVFSARDGQWFRNR